MTDGQPLTGRVAVVTGASRGIGRATAAALRHAGAEVVISGRTAETLDAAAVELGVTGVVADATDPAEVTAPVEAAISAFGGVDILVNNVGGHPGGNSDIFTGEADVFDRTIALNLGAAFHATRAAVTSMRDRGDGRIINIGSGASRRAVASIGYTAAKHGLVGMTVQLAATLGQLGITVNCVCPGWTDTDLVDFGRIAAARGTSAEAERRAAEATSAQGRIISPAEVASVVAFLASPEARAVNGQVIGADGGFRL